MKSWTIILLFVLAAGRGQAQSVRVQLRDALSGAWLSGAEVSTADSLHHWVSDSTGMLALDPKWEGQRLRASAVGYFTKEFTIRVNNNIVQLMPIEKEMNAVVVSGTLRAVRKLPDQLRKGNALVAQIGCISVLAVLLVAGC